MKSQHQEESLTDFDSLWDYDNPAETEKKFQALLPKAETSKNVPYHTELLTQIARAQGLQRKFREADHTLQQAEALLPKAGERAKIRFLLEKGRTLNSSGKPSEAKPLFQQAWKLASETNEEFLAIDAAHMMAIIELGAHKLEWNMKGLQLAEEARDPRSKKWRGSLHNNIGWDHYENGQYSQAYESFRHALRAREEEGDINKIRIAQWCIAKTLRRLNRVEEALEIQRQLLAEHERANERPGYVYEELGECLLLLKQKTEASKFFLKAYEELSKDEWLRANEPTRLERMKELGLGTGQSQLSV